MRFPVVLCTLSVVLTSSAVVSVGRNKPVHLVLPSLFQRPNNATLVLSPDPLPNPFDVPDTDMTLFFLEQPEIIYPRRDVVALLVQAITRIGAHIQVHGDVPLTRPAIERYKNLELLVDLTGYPTYVNRVMYSELRGALEGFSMKMAHEGFWNVARLVSPDSRDTDTSSALATKEMQIHAKTTPGTTNTAVAGNYNTDWTAAMSFMDRGIPVHGFLVAIVVRALGG